MSMPKNKYILQISKTSKVENHKKFGNCYRKQKSKHLFGVRIHILSQLRKQIARSTFLM